MKCEQCGHDMMVIDTKFTSELDTTDVFVHQDMACTNSKCALYAGQDLKKAKNKKVNRNKVG